MNHARAIVATSALLAVHSARAQDMSMEVGSATVWFALLVVVFALLVSVGLFVARDRNDDDESTDDAAAARSPTPARFVSRRTPGRRHVHARGKQQQEAL